MPGNIGEKILTLAILGALAYFIWSRYQNKGKGMFSGTSNVGKDTDFYQGIAGGGYHEPKWK